MSSAKMDGRDIKEITGFREQLTREGVEVMFANYVAGKYPTLHLPQAVNRSKGQINAQLSYPRTPPIQPDRYEEAGVLQVERE
ncbi:MAG: hypothetical protein DMG47_22460 [Acidobacteria bacterium]|nr:MAG: hypothetical protein DMG47_22460 [Acidobacteriota bacterium]